MGCFFFFNESYFSVVTAFRAFGKTVLLPDLYVMLKILSLEYHAYGCGRIFSHALIPTKMPRFAKGSSVTNFIGKVKTWPNGPGQRKIAQPEIDFFLFNQKITLPSIWQLQTKERGN